ncbi:MAG: sirohydrochlorin chelatase [Nitrospinota bacterium]
MKTALILVGHGSKKEEANRTLLEVAAQVKASLGLEIVEAAFLQLAEPGLDEALAVCVGEGAERVILIPYFLYMGAHVTKDIPAWALEAKSRYPQIELIVGKHLGYHPKLAEVVAERVREALGC